MFDFLGTGRTTSGLTGITGSSPRSTFITTGSTPITTGITQTASSRPSATTTQPTGK